MYIYILGSNISIQLSDLVIHDQAQNIMYVIPAPIARLPLPKEAWSS